MIELIVMLGVIGWFYRTANIIERSGFFWAIVGAGSYIVPVIIVRGLIIPLVFMGRLTYQNLFGFQMLGVVLSIPVGIGGCFLARYVLLSTSQERISRIKDEIGSPDLSGQYADLLSECSNLSANKIYDKLAILSDTGQKEEAGALAQYLISNYPLTKQAHWAKKYL